MSAAVTCDVRFYHVLGMNESCGDIWPKWMKDAMNFLVNCMYLKFTFLRISLVFFVSLIYGTGFSMFALL